MPDILLKDAPFIDRPPAAFKHAGTEASRPATGEGIGDTYYAYDTQKLFVWNGTAWAPFQSGSTLDVTHDASTFNDITEIEFQGDGIVDVTNPTPGKVVVETTDGGGGGGGGPEFEGLILHYQYSNQPPWSGTQAWPLFIETNWTVVAATSNFFGPPYSSSSDWIDLPEDPEGRAQIMKVSFEAQVEFPYSPDRRFEFVIANQSDYWIDMIDYFTPISQDTAEGGGSNWGRYRIQLAGIGVMTTERSLLLQLLCPGASSFTQPPYINAARLTVQRLGYLPMPE